MLSKKCQYALHALHCIAQQPEGTHLNISEIALNKDLPKKFLEIILADLKSAGILQSKRGKFGGYYLTRPAKEINILEVIRTIDGAVAMLPCVSLNFYSACKRCKDQASCSISAIFRKVRDETLKILSTHTLDDLVSGNDNMLYQELAGENQLAIGAATAHPNAACSERSLE
jgi:Rrf2 family protein